MTRLPLPLILAAFFAAAALPAHGCELLLEREDGPKPARLDDIGPGIVSGILSCGQTRRLMQFWSLAVDPDQPGLGVRDGKLFDTRYTGPLTELFSAKVEDHVHLSVHERTETVPLSRSPLPGDRHSIRRFVTFCDVDGSPDPLDCSLGATRLKARATARDSDRDGYLDMSLHEISFYDGGSKLHVMSFVTPYSASLTADIGTWIEAINAVSDVLSHKELASVD